MKELGKKAIELIKQDAKAGISQDKTGSSLGSYRSEKYKKYKANYMKRFTDRTGRKGTKLKQYSGQSVASNETGFVNETLTGQMFRGLHIDEAKENEVTIAYMPKDAGKVIGAKNLGRELVGLNDKNIEMLQEAILKELDKEIEKYCKEDVVINIGK